MVSLLLWLSTGKKVYFQEEWLKAMHLFEKSLDIFKETIRDCFYMCEDVINVNLTQPNMNKIKEKLLEDYNFKADTMEFYDLLVTSIREVCTYVHKIYIFCPYTTGSCYVTWSEDGTT